MAQSNNISKTEEKNYTDTLIRKQLVWWKRALNVQAPYRWKLRQINPGFTLEIGCGIGRNLVALKGKGVGIDHNPHSVEIAKKRDLLAFTPDEFKASPYNKPQRFDSLLFSHVFEHVGLEKTKDLLKEYMGFLRHGGKLIIITPQEAGYKKDVTHVEYLDFEKLRDVIKEAGFRLLEECSFPFPRVLGRFFIYNEFISVSCKP